MCSRNSCASPLALDLEQRLQPAVRLALHVGQRNAFVLVHPVRSDAGFRNPMHLLGADLDLHRQAVRADQRGVQRLVAVRLRDCDVVLELSGNRLVKAVQGAERNVAGRNVCDDDAVAVDIVHLGKRQVLLDHLAVRGIQVLRAPGDARIDPAVGELRLDRLKRFGDHLAPVAPGCTRRLVEHAVAQRVQVRERQFLQLVEQRVEAEAVGDRGVDLHRLARDAPALGRRNRAERLHVVQPVGQLDQDDAHVARHRQQHLAEVLRLRMLGGLELDLVELGEAVDEVGDRLAERLRDLGLRDGRVFHHVVQQCRDERLPVEMPRGENLRYRERMRDVRLARLACLSGMRRLREAVRLGEPRDVARLQVPEAGFIQCMDRSHRARVRPIVLLR